MALTKVSSGMLSNGGGDIATNVASGTGALNSNTTGNSSVAVGYQAGYSSQTGALNTFVGFQAGYLSAISGNGFNAVFGSRAGQAMTTAQQNTFIGDAAGLSTTGSFNTLVGQGAGNLITVGAKNTVLGIYNGNQGGVDIRGANNRIVLSDGDGNPRGYCDADGVWNFGVGGSAQTWTTQTGSRSLGTTYTNSTNKPIMVIVSLNQANNGIGHQVTVGGATFNAFQVNGGASGITSSSYFIVPCGATYNIAAQTGESIGNWLELR